MEKDNYQDINNKIENNYQNIPFEEIGHYGLIRGFFLTIKMLILTPRKFYRTMHVNKGYRKPLLFALIMITINVFFSNIYMSLGLMPTPQEQIEQMIEMSQKNGANSSSMAIAIPDLQYQITSKDSNQIKIFYPQESFITGMTIDSSNVKNITISAIADTTDLQFSLSTLHLSAESVINIRPGKSTDNIREFQSDTKITVRKNKEILPYQFSLSFILNNIFISLSVFLVLVSIWHLGLIAIGASRNGFQATFRILAYSTVLAIFKIIPMNSVYLSFVIYTWWMILIFKGIAEAHEQRNDKAILGTIIPFTIAMLIFIISLLG